METAYLCLLLVAVSAVDVVSANFQSIGLSNEQVRTVLRIFITPFSKHNVRIFLKQKFTLNFQNANSESEAARSVFVGNIPHTTTKDQLAKVGE